MDRICDLLVIVDPTSDLQPAVEKAAFLASKLKASVELLACDTKSSRELRIAKKLTDSPQSGSVPGSAHSEPVPSLESWLDRLAAPLRTQGVDVRTSIVSGDPLPETLLKWIHDSPADLVIKDTHHHSRVMRTFIGNTDWQLIRHCPLPLLLAKPTHWHAHPAFAAAVDPSHPGDRQALLDHRILDYAHMLAGRTNGSVQVVHAYFPAMIAATVSPVAPSPLDVAPEVLAAERSLHLSMVKPLLAPYGIPAECIHVDMGVPSEYLPRVAESCQLDVMVMGALSRNHLMQAIIGSTAERVLEYLPCDVLLIKPAKFGERLPF